MQAGQGASHGSAERGTGGDRGSAQGHTQGAGRGTRGKERGRKGGQGAEASGSGEGQSAASGRCDAGQGAGKGPGHGKGAQGREQGAKAGGHGAHGAERGAVGERGRSQGHGHGHRKGTGAGSAGQGAVDRERDPRHGQGERGVGAGKGPKGKGKGALGPQEQTGRGMGALGGGQSKGRGTGAGAPPQPDVQPVRCIPPGIQQMPAHHTHHHHHHHAHLYNIDPEAGELIPLNPPRPQHQPTPPRRGRSRRGWPLPRRGGGAGRSSGAAATGAEGGAGARGRGGTVPDPLGDEAFPPVVEVYGWLSWACSGTTRQMRNRPFDGVLLQRDGGNQEVPRGGWAVPEDHERVLRAVIRAAWPDREQTWPFWRGGRCSASRMQRPTTGSPGPCATPPPTGATADGTRHRHSPSPHTSGDAGDGPDGGRGRVGGGQCRGAPPPAESGTPTHAPRTVQRDGGARATSNGREGGGNERKGGPTAPRPTKR